MKPGCGCHHDRVERIEDIGAEVDIEVVRDHHHHHVDRELIVEEDVRLPYHAHKLPAAPCKRPYVPPKPADRIEESIHKSRPEVLIHKPSALLFNRAPTLVRINHSPIVYKPQPVYFHRSADVTHQKTIHKHLDRPVHVRNEVTKVVEPIVEKVLVEKKHAPPCNKKIVEEVVEEVVEGRCPHKHLHLSRPHLIDREIELDIVGPGPRAYEEIID